MTLITQKDMKRNFGQEEEAKRRRLEQSRLEQHIDQKCTELLFKLDAYRSSGKSFPSDMAAMVQQVEIPCIYYQPNYSEPKKAAELLAKMDTVLARMQELLTPDLGKRKWLTNYLMVGLETDTPVVESIQHHWQSDTARQRANTTLERELRNENRAVTARGNQILINRRYFGGDGQYVITTQPDRRTAEAWVDDEIIDTISWWPDKDGFMMVENPPNSPQRVSYADLQNVVFREWIDRTEPLVFPEE